MDCDPNQHQRTSRLTESGSLPQIPEDLASKASSPEVSVVMPVQNETDTLEACLEKAQRALCEHKIAGEIIVADNGSTDGSQAIATRMGARLVHVESKGYGTALMGGIAAARGKFVIMGDADDSYDFLEIPRFVGKLRAGFDLVQGCRLPSGGGTVLPGAMPPLHRWWGNPMFASMTRRMFRAPIRRSCARGHKSVAARRYWTPVRLSGCFKQLRYQRIDRRRFRLAASQQMCSSGALRAGSHSACLCPVAVIDDRRTRVGTGSFDAAHNHVACFMDHGLYL